MPELLTVPEVAQRLRVKPDTVRKWIQKGVLRSVRMHGRRKHLVPASELEALNAMV